MAVDPVLPRSRRNVLLASIGGLAGLLVSRLAQPQETDATTGTMVYGTVMDEGVDQTSLTSSGDVTAIFHNAGSVLALQAIAAGVSESAILGANTSNGPGVFGGSNGGNGVEGGSVHGNGVFGTSTSGGGLLGIRTSGIGVIGQSTSSAGVVGFTAATDQPGLYGQSTSNNTGTIGLSGGALPSAPPAKTGVYGYAAQDSASVGAKGESTAGTGTSGVSATGSGAKGSSTSGAGVVGSSTSSCGLLATSVSASGVAAASAASDQPGILGVSNGNQTGIFGLSRTGSGVVPVPVTPANTGVYGLAIQDATAVGVQGESTTGTGVLGQATTGTGVLGQSVSNVGLLGFVGASTLPTPPVGTAMFGASAVGAHDVYAGGSGRMGLLPNLSAGPAHVRLIRSRRRVLRRGRQPVGMRRGWLARVVPQGCRTCHGRRPPRDHSGARL